MFMLCISLFSTAYESVCTEMQCKRFKLHLTKVWLSQEYVACYHIFQTTLFPHSFIRLFVCSFKYHHHYYHRHSTVTHSHLNSACRNSIVNCISLSVSLSSSRSLARSFFYWSEFWACVCVALLLAFYIKCSATTVNMYKLFFTFTNICYIQFQWDLKWFFDGMRYSRYSGTKWDTLHIFAYSHTCSQPTMTFVMCQLEHPDAILPAK